MAKKANDMIVCLGFLLFLLFYYFIIILYILAQDFFSPLHVMLYFLFHKRDWDHSIFIKT